jgi:hypothetical protein
LKKISEPQNIDHTTQSDLHTFWLVLAMAFGEMNFVTVYVVPLSQKCFPSMQVLPGLISISILMETPGTVGKKLGPCFYLAQ